ncbi:MAG: MFS transporter, partial [Planctomycetota bacterium]
MNETPRAWYEGITRYQWTVLVIASLGWSFDVFEGALYVATRTAAWGELLGTTNTANWDMGALAAFLVGGALGGVFFGSLSDRIGRVRTLIFTILMYSLFTCLTAFSQTAWQLLVLRFLVATGVGGNWAVASAMVAEVFPKHARAWSLSIFHASSLMGVLLAVAVGTFLGTNPAFGWRWCYGVGLLPALLCVWVFKSLREPEQWLQAKELAREGRSRQTGRIAD